jgi:hypothetical protein
MEAIKEALRYYLLSDKNQLAFLKLGSLCNAPVNHSFTEAKCNTVAITKPGCEVGLTVAFTRIFRHGMLLLKDFVGDKKHILLDYEKKALKKLVEFLEHKGRHAIMKS